MKSGRCVVCGKSDSEGELSLCHCCRSFLCRDCRSIHGYYSWILCPTCLRQETEADRFLGEVYSRVERSFRSVIAKSER
jgi:hypothetical protein